MFVTKKDNLVGIVQSLTTGLSLYDYFSQKKLTTKGERHYPTVVWPCTGSYTPGC